MSSDFRAIFSLEPKRDVRRAISDLRFTTLVAIVGYLGWGQRELRREAAKGALGLGMRDPGVFG